MTRPLEWALSSVLCALCILAAVSLAECRVWGAEPAVSTATAVSRLQPRLDADAARQWAEAIEHAARPHRLDPILIAALVMRESSYDPDVAEGRRVGSRGEVGVMQVMPGGAALLFAPPRCSQAEAWCSLATGCGYLAYQRDHACPGSTWRWVAAYGRSRCPSEAEAREDTATRRARDLFRRAGGRGWVR